MSAKKKKTDTGEAQPVRPSGIKGDLSQRPLGSFTVDDAKIDVYRALYEVLKKAKTADDWGDANNSCCGYKFPDRATASTWYRIWKTFFIGPKPIVKDCTTLALLVGYAQDGRKTWGWIFDRLLKRDRNLAIDLEIESIIGGESADFTPLTGPSEPSVDSSAGRQTGKRKGRSDARDDAVAHAMEGAVVHLDTLNTRQGGGSI